MEKEDEKPVKKQSLLNCIYEEIVRGSAVSEDDANYLIKEQRIITFLSIPWELEKVLYLGYLVCLDAFLFLFTFLPIRTVCAAVKILFWVLKKFLFLDTPPIDKGHICDIFRVAIMGACIWILSWVNISMLYHLIRGQSVIKLYFIYNVLEIVDYLCLSFGSDVMEALFWLTIRNKRKKREHVGVLWHWVLACIYTTIHSMCFLIQLICLSVAINSHNKSLLVVMTSNQYMELKSYLFKKFDYMNNYQIVARDVRERFSYTVVLVMVFIRNMSQLEWDTAHMWDIFPDVAVIVISEILIDWIKHAFVTKFNGIPVETYNDYRYQLYDDLLNPQHFKQTFSNRMDLMARKILFIAMPLACLTVTVLLEVIPDDLELETHEYLKYGAITIVTLFIVKIINMGLILRNAEQLRKERPIYSTPVIPPIRNVNSSVKLPTFPPSTPTTPLLTPTDPLAASSLSTIDETATSSTTSSVELVTLTPSRSAPDLTSLEPPSPSNLSPSTPSPSNLSPSPEVFYRNTSADSHSNHSRGSPESSTSVSLPTLDSPDGIENEPPLENVRNLNSNENMGEGLRKRTAVSFEDQ
ncbi:transmembrane anterior posterior transformation protein 1 homolog isoform X2 [Bolinopsis microptera]|uniref:transmembrane anterior posterior transformation protein 1 homolog isoform X1 n=1 Tax=Bolinopsis microptera TaxID=2820187 RepID=UPI003078AAE9